MNKLIYIVVGITFAVSTQATDYAKIGYERVVNEDYGFSFWLPPGYNAEEESRATVSFDNKTFLYVWPETKYEGLFLAVLYVNSAGNEMDLTILKEAEGVYLAEALVGGIDETPLTEKDLLVRNADEGFFESARYEKQNEDNALFDYTALYLKSGDNLYVITCASPVKGAKSAKEGREFVVNSFRANTEEPKKFEPDKDKKDKNNREKYNTGKKSG